jgi:hypothetical protein
MPIQMRRVWRVGLGPAAACAVSAIVLAGCGGSAADAERPADAGAGDSAEPTPGPGAASGERSESLLVRRVARQDCHRAEPVPVSRVASNPKARRVGPVVFTPLALSRSITPYPDDIAGARTARSIKVGVTVISGGPSARVAIWAPGGARLLYGAELIEALADGSLRWSNLPTAVVFERCRSARGGAVTTGFPGGFILRQRHTCVRLRVTDGQGRLTTKWFAFGRGVCGQELRP